MADRDDLIDDYKQFTREMLLRFERAMREMGAERNDWRAEMKQSRAQRQALLRILDRLDPGGTAPAT